MRALALAAVLALGAVACSEDDPPRPTTTTASTTTTTTTTTTTAADEPCRNTYEPACGAFRWSRPPEPDDPIEITVDAPATAAVGEVVTFHLHVADDDTIDQLCLEADFADGSPVGGCTFRDCDAFGEWDPPPKRRDTFRTTVTHAFAAPGTYEATFGFRSGECPSPYGSTGSATTTVVVT